MNTFMFDHPLTSAHRETLSNLLKFNEIPAMEKKLMCGDLGIGAMASVQTITEVVQIEIEKHFV